jgi:hypothetical protein
MNLDEALRQPLASVRDDGFSAAIILKLARAEERRRLALWGAVGLALLPVAALLAPTAEILLPHLAQAASSPAFAYVAGAALLLWALRPTRVPKF